MTSTKRQRASGESSIYQDEDGRRHGYVSMGKKDNGVRDRRHVSAMKRADVVAKVRALESQAGRRGRRGGGTAAHDR
jgi:integrase